MPKLIVIPKCMPRITKLQYKAVLKSLFANFKRRAKKRKIKEVISGIIIIPRIPTVKIKKINDVPFDKFICLLLKNLIWCPGEDLNLHPNTWTTTSR